MDGLLWGGLAVGTSVGLIAGLRGKLADRLVDGVVFSSVVGRPVPASKVPRITSTVLDSANYGLGENYTSIFLAR